MIGQPFSLVDSHSALTLREVCDLGILISYTYNLPYIVLILCTSIYRLLQDYTGYRPILLSVKTLSTSLIFFALENFRAVGPILVH